MKSFFYFVCLVTPLWLFGQTNLKKILIVGTNIAKYNHKVNGTYLMEIAIPFNYLEHQGYEVDIVTPAGGNTAIYHKGDTVKILKDIYHDRNFSTKTKTSLNPKQVIANQYQAIIFPGGYGHFEDVLNNTQIAEIARQIYESGGVIGSLGHGTADLLNIRLSNGDYFVKGKTLTCFPTWAEKEFMTEADFGKLLPVDMQSELEKRGALVKVCTRETQSNSKDLLITDKNNRLVTASFAEGGEYVAKEIVSLLKNKSKKQE